MRPLFLFEPGFLGRKDNTLIFENAKIKRKLPIKGFNTLFLLNEITLNTKLLSFLSRQHIPVFFYSYKGDYVGVFMPHKQKWFSGKLLIKQVVYYLDYKKRMTIAKEIIKASIHNMRKVIMKYKLEKESEDLKRIIDSINEVNNIESLLLVEANARRIYYSCFDKIIKKKEFEFISRSFHPPSNEVNAMLSFGNALMYGIILSEIFKTQLDPSISFVHEPQDNRYSLQLDLADIFKPLLVDRLVFSLINKGVIKTSDFELMNGGVYLNKHGRIVFVEYFNNYILNTIKIGNKNVSYRNLIRGECYKLINHIMKDKKLNCFKMWW